MPSGVVSFSSMLWFEVPDASGPILNHFRRLWSKVTFWLFRVMSDQLLLKNLILYGYWDHSDRRKILVNGSSSLDLRGEKCDLTAVSAVESHFCENMTFPFWGIKIWLRFGSRGRIWLLSSGDRELLYFQGTGRLAVTNIWGQGLRLAVTDIEG